MRIKADEKFRQEILKKIEERELYERTGTHATDVIYCINKQALRRLKPLPITDHEILLYSLGWMSQRWLTGQSEDVPEIEIDGIITTVDALFCPKCGGIFNGRE